MVMRWATLGEPRISRCAIALLGLYALLLALPAAAQSLDTLSRRMHQAMADERWERALEAGLGIVALEPSSPTAHYNLACVLARMGKSQAAVEALQKAAELGFAGLTTLRTDPDLESVRATAGYAAALVRVEATHMRRFAAFKQRADRSEPLIYPPPARKKKGGDGKGEAGRSLIVLLHGRGGRAAPMARFFRPSAAKIGAVLVVPEAFEPYADGFQWGIVEQAIYRVEHAIEYAAARHSIDRERVIVAGFSQGGYVSLISAARDPRRYAGVVALGACDRRGFELEGRRFEDPPPVYVGIGSQDRSFDGCKPMARLYEQAGFEVKLRVYLGYGHTLPKNYEWELDRALRFVLDDAR